ncbi:MAG: amidohydrolase family protein [Clostridia bacterium]|nr:amidohydrolase family protein [Clostridia bacterium]
MKRFADSHIHMALSDPDRAQRLLDTIASIGVTDTAIQCIVSSPKAEIVYNLSALWWKSKYDKMRIKVFGSVHEFDVYADIPYDVQVEKLLSLGCDGIKFIHMKPNVRKALGKGLDHPSYDKMFELLEKRGTPVTIHSGDPENFWGTGEGQSADEVAKGWTYADGTYLSCEEHYRETLARLDKNPKLNVILAHMFFLSEYRERAEEILQKYPNVKLDLTPGWEMYIAFSKDTEGWHDFFEKYSERILFGTDSGNHKDNNAELNRLVYSAITHDSSEFPMPAFPDKVIRGLHLSDRAVENICYNNYIRYTGGETPVSVDMAGLRECAAQMLKDIGDMPDRQDSARWLEMFLEATK